MKIRAGFVLVSVLWLVVAITSASMALALTARKHRLIAITRAESVSARWAAVGSIGLARADLSARFAGSYSFDSLVLDPLARLDTLVTENRSFGDVDCHLTLDDPAAKVNLNRASRTELQRFFFAVTRDVELSSAMSYAIITWRGELTPDELELERRSYQAAGYAVLPPGRPFYSTTELKHVRQMSVALYERIADHVTVVGSGHVNLNTASEPVLRSISGISDELAAMILRMRSQQEPITDVTQLGFGLSAKNRQEFLANFPEIAARTITRTTQLHVTANAQHKSGVGKSSVEVLIAIDPQLQVAWQRFD